MRLMGYFRMCKLGESAYVKVEAESELCLRRVRVSRDDNSGLHDYAIFLNDFEIAYYDLDCYESFEKMDEQVKKDLAKFADQLNIGLVCEKAWRD